jgi:UDP-glucose 4-epimerase
MTISSPTSLVTGGAGFIGSHVAQRCLTLGHRVIVFDDLSGGFEDQIPQGALFIQGSVADSDLVARIFQSHKIDYVYHLAAYAAEGLSHFIRHFNYSNNLLGSINLINESVKSGVRCFVFASSIAVYGKNQVPMREDLAPQPEDPYGISKYAVELDLRAAHELFGLNFIVFRPHNVYGEHQNLGDPYRNVIGIFMRQLMSGHPLTVFGDGTQCRAFSHVDDVAPHIAASVAKPEALNDIFNIGANSVFSINELISNLRDVTGVTASVQYHPTRKEVHTAYATHEKAHKLLGVNPTLPLRDGLQRMWDWAQSAGLRASKHFEHIELDQNMPPSWKNLKATLSSDVILPGAARARSITFER